MAESITMVSSTRSRPLLFLEAFLQLSEIVRQAKTVVRKRTSGVDKSHGHDFAGKLREPDRLPILIGQGEIRNRLTNNESAGQGRRRRDHLLQKAHPAGLGGIQFQIFKRPCPDVVGVGGVLIDHERDVDRRTGP